MELLEGTAIHWTKQLKVLAQQQDAARSEEGGGVLAEVAFWRARAANLAGVQDQLASAGMSRPPNHAQGSSSLPRERNSLTIAQL